MSATTMDEVATATERLAVLLSGGIPPPSAWDYLGADARDEPVLSIARLVADGMTVPEAIIAACSSESLPPSRRQEQARAAWRCLAAAWSVAVECGAPLASTLDRLATSFRDLADVLRDCEVALAGPRASARIVLALPLISWAFSLLSGTNAPVVLVSTVPGLACAAIGLVLMLVAVAWTRSMVRTASRIDTQAGVATELIAIALSSGMSVQAARRAVEQALSPPADAHASGERATRERRREHGSIERATPDSSVESTLALSQRAGVAAGRLLLGVAAQARRAERTRARVAAARLATRLTLPLGLCVLPAFVLLGVAPVIIAVVSSTGSLL